MAVLDWTLDIEPAALVAYVKAARERDPDLDFQEFAKLEFSKVRWKATASGVVTGLPANIWVSLPAATSDIAYVLKQEVTAAARCATFLDEHYFDDRDARWGLLVPLFGIDVASQFGRELGIRGGMGATRATIKAVLKKETLEIFKKWVLKYFGIKVTQKGIITKTLPVIGAAIGGIWNWVEVGIVRDRTIAFLSSPEGQQACPEPEPSGVPSGPLRSN